MTGCTSCDGGTPSYLAWFDGPCGRAEPCGGHPTCAGCAADHRIARPAVLRTLASMPDNTDSTGDMP